MFLLLFPSEISSVDACVSAGARGEFNLNFQLPENVQVDCSLSWQRAVQSIETDLEVGKKKDGEIQYVYENAGIYVGGMHVILVLAIL